MSAITDIQVKEDIRNWLARYAVNANCTSLNNDGNVDRIYRWVTAARDLSARVASVLGDETIPVNFEYHAATAWTDGDTVSISLPWFLDTIASPIVEGERDALKLAWAEMKGIVYHELSHIIWTPRKNQKPTHGIRKLHDDTHKIWTGRGYSEYAGMQKINGIYVDLNHASVIARTTMPKPWFAFNMIEDARIETLFAARYTPAISLFQAMIGRVFLGNQKADDSRNFLLLWGRKYLPLKLRNATKETFAKKFDTELAKWNLPNTDALADLIDEYITLTFPKDGDRALEIVQVMSDVMWVIGCVTGQDMNDVTIDTHTDPATEGRPTSPSEQRADAERASQKFDDSADADADADADTDADDGEGEGEGNSDGGDGIDSDADADGLSGSNGKSNTGTALEEMLDDIQNDLDREFRSLQQAAGENDTSTIPAEVNSPVHNHRMTGDFVWPFTARRQLSDEITNVFSDTEAGWQAGMATGRLNIQAVMDSQASDQFRSDVFDQWQEDVEEATSFHVVILLDTSGSMSQTVATGKVDAVSGRHQYVSFAKQAAGAAWALTRALEDNDIPVTVIGYDSVSAVLKDADSEMPDAVVPQWPTGGGTNIHDALEWARDTFANSDKQNKILVTITDGMFDTYTNLMNDLNAMADTLLVHLDLENRGLTDFWGSPAGDGDQTRGHKDSVIFTKTDDLKHFASMVGRKVIDIAASVNVAMVA